jgi:D-mannonate dehydratase
MHYKDEPLTNVLRDLGKQAETDVQIEEYAFFAPLDWVRTNLISINLTDATFWRRCGRWLTAPIWSRTMMARND